jgi:transcriptional regulator with XRE-family HTH domain
MATPKDLSRDIGSFIRDLRRNAQISLRQLAAQAGVSNPYLSQVERGLRKPSAEVLQQLASALRVSTPVMYLRAGLLDDGDNPSVLHAIAVDPDLSMAQKQSLSQIYETFRRENLRQSEAQATAPAAPPPGDESRDEAGDGSAAPGVVNTAAAAPSARDAVAPTVDETSPEAVKPAVSSATEAAVAAEEEKL